MENFNSCCGLLRRKQQTNYNHRDELYMVVSNPIYAPMDYNKTNHFSHGTQMVTIANYPPVKMSDIRNVAGGSTPDAISEYYKGGSYINGANQCAGTVPTGGEISFSDFYNLHADKEYGTHGAASGSWNGVEFADWAHTATISVSASSTNTQTLSFSVCVDRRAPHSDNLTIMKQRTPGIGSYSSGNWSGSLGPGSSVQREYQWGHSGYSPGYYYGEAFLGYTTASGSCSCNGSRFSSTHT